MLYVIFPWEELARVPRCKQLTRIPYAQAQPKPKPGISHTQLAAHQPSALAGLREPPHSRLSHRLSLLLLAPACGLVAQGDNVVYLHPGQQWKLESGIWQPRTALAQPVARGPGDEQAQEITWRPLASSSGIL
jgi:hypothetical protein